MGHYYDTYGRYILKIGTTNDLKRRQLEHTRNYRRAEEYTLPQDGKFIYDWFLRLSRYNTLRYEDKTRAKWQEENIGEYVRNDRFSCIVKPSCVQVKIRKTYVIQLN